MTLWVRFDGGFGVLSGETIAVHDGDMFGANTPTGEVRSLADTRLLAPMQPGKFIGLWNNFYAVAARTGQPAPNVPLYFLKANSSIIGPEDGFRAPPGYDGKVVYEGELGVVIGTRCFNVSEAEASAHIFGYTCVNDITAADLFFAADPEFPSFPQWARAKSFDGFGPFGPVIATDIDPITLSIRTILNGAERQNYPVSDMIFQPDELVSKLSHDMTLEPGDLILCGTSVGVGVMKEAVNTVTIAIDGIGELRNEFHL